MLIDDIMCFSKNGAEHVADLERFLERLTIFNLKLAPKKAYTRVRVIKFLGHRVTTKGIQPDPEKVEAMTKLPMPSNKCQSVTITVGCFVVLPEIFAANVNCDTTS